MNGDTDLMALLAQVCGYHDGDGCEHCTEALWWRRERWGWSDERIIEDATLFRDDQRAWYERAVEQIAAEREARAVADA